MPLIENTPPIGNGHQRGKVGADGIKRKGNIDIRAVEQRRAAGLKLRPSRHGRWAARGRMATTRAATRAFSSSVSPGNGDESAGRLIAGDLRRHLFDAAGGLNAIGQTDVHRNCRRSLFLLRLRHACIVDKRMVFECQLV
jgi:hypothetical protein